MDTANTTQLPEEVKMHVHPYDVEGYADADHYAQQRDAAAKDRAAIGRVVEWLKGERGALSANVTLPSGRQVVVHVDGKVVG